MPIARLAAPALVLTLAACVHEGTYPSLAPRAVERRDWTEQPAPAPAPIADDPALDARIDAAQAAVGTAADAFATADGRASPLVAAARGMPAGSERWVAAQAAIADLDAARAGVAQAADALEDLAATRAQALVPDYPRLEAARAAAAARLAGEDARIAALSASLPAQ